MSHPRRGTLQWLALLTCLLATAPSGAAAAQAPQACEMGTISEITFNRQKPFLPEATSEEATLGWLFRGMDAVHITTTEGTIRWEFLFEEGELARALEGFLYDMEPYDPEMLIGVAIVLILVSAVACLAPALGATTVDPVSVLKGDERSARSDPVVSYVRSWLAPHPQRIGYWSREPVAVLGGAPHPPLS